MSSVEQANAPKIGDDRGRVVSPLNGAVMPKGRQKGTQNKVTKTIREAVEYAAREVTDSQGRKGLAAWLLERANGSVADRQIFAGMMAKALPLTVNATGAGITINLGWLQGRGIVDVTPATQGNSKALIHNEDSRIINQDDATNGETDRQVDKIDPPPPMNRQGGEGA